MRVMYVSLAEMDSKRPACEERGVEEEEGECGQRMGREVAVE